MLGPFTSFVDFLLKAGSLALIANEIRGLILAAPVIYGIYQAGGALTAIWLGICSLGGIAISVIAPIFVARKIRKRWARRPKAAIA